MCPKFTKKIKTFLEESSLKEPCKIKFVGITSVLKYGLITIDVDCW